MNKKLLLTGAKGLVGSEIKADVRVGSECNLIDPHQTEDLINKHKPTHIIHCAGKVGGIGGNMNAMGSYFYDNLMISTNIIESAKNHNVQKLLCFTSTCVFPAQVEYPLTEDKIHLGPPHETNYGYGYAKRMAEVQIRAYNQQYGTKYFTVIPCNIYGFNDNYNIEISHVIPSLIHKVYLAKLNNTNVNVWGTGRALREFIFAKDVAEICTKLVQDYEDTKPIIISNSQEISIEDVVITICKIIGFKNKIIFNTNKPDGQFRKPSDNSYLKSIIGDHKFTSLVDGLEQTIEFFIKNYKNVRK